MFFTPTPDLIDGLTVIAAVTIASILLCPLLCWILTWGYRTPGQLASPADNNGDRANQPASNSLPSLHEVP